MADIRRGSQAPLVLAFGEDRFFLVLVEFVLDVADDLFQHVFHGDQAGNAAMLVDDDRQVVAAGAELAQQHVQALDLGDEHGRPDQRADIQRRLEHVAQQVLGEQDADDVVAVVFVDRKARVRGLDDGGEQLRQRLGDIEQIHARARHHDVGDGALGHGQRALDHGVGLCVEQLALVRGFEDGLDAFAVFRLAPHQGKQTVQQGFGRGFGGALSVRLGSRVRVGHRPGGQVGKDSA